MARTPVAQRRRDLVAAALRVIGTSGLAGASTRAIVAEAGMSLASFHYAFSSRDELLDLLVKDVLGREEKAVLPEVLAGKSLRELLEEGLMGYLDHLRTDPLREQAMLELTQLAVRSRQPLAHEQYEEYSRIAMGALELAARETAQHWIPRIDTVARLLVSVTDGLTIGWLVDRDDAAAEATVRAAAAALASLAEPA